METRLELIKCLICGQDKCKTDNFKDNCDKNESSIIDKHLQVIFLLRNILEVPSSKLVIFLKSHPNLESWLSVCDKCKEMADNCKTTYQAILEAQRKFRRVKQEVIQILKRSALIKQEISREELDGFQDNPVDIVEQIRGFVFKNQYPKITDPFISGDRLAYQQLTHKVDKALKQLEEEDDDNQSSKGSNNLQEDLEDDWIPSDNEQADKVIQSSSSKSTVRKRRKALTSGSRKKKYKRGTFICSTCSKVFPYQVYLNKHIKIHDQRQSATCDLCGSTFLDTSKLLSHQPKCTGESVPCPIAECSLKFDNDHTLTRHLRDTHNSSKTEDPRRSCSFCGKYFPKFMQLKRHIRSVHDQKDSKFNCDLCGLGKRSNLELQQHRKNCKGESLSCPMAGCGMKCTTSTTLSYHVTTTHKDKADDLLPFKCLECGNDKAGFLNAKQLKNHMLWKHRRKKGEGGLEGKKEKGPWICETCGRSYSLRGSFTRHRRLNIICRGLRGEKRVEEMKEVICEICGASFKSKSSLSIHVKVVHEKRFTMTCEICGQGKNGRSKMEKHMWQKHKVGDGRKWRCEVEGCTVKIYGRKDRDDHMKKHRGEEQGYKCEECGKGFYMYRNIMQHVKEVHQGKRGKRRGEVGKVKREEEGDEESNDS